MLAFAISMTVGLAAAPALAKIPYFAAKCPTDISVETDRAGRAYLSGKFIPSMRIRLKSGAGASPLML